MHAQDDGDPVEWQRRYWRLMEWQRFASDNGSKCFTFRHPVSDAERQGQAEAIRREGRIYRFAVQWVTPEAFEAMDGEQRMRCHQTVRPFDRTRV
jgi:hypothetical protein